MNECSGPDRFRSEALLAAGRKVLIACRAAGRAGHVHGDAIGLARFQRHMRLRIEFHIPVRTRHGDRRRRTRSVPGKLAFRTAVRLQIKGILFRGFLRDFFVFGNPLADFDVFDGDGVRCRRVTDLHAKNQRTVLRTLGYRESLAETCGTAVIFDFQPPASFRIALSARIMRAFIRAAAVAVKDLKGHVAFLACHRSADLILRILFKCHAGVDLQPHAPHAARCTRFCNRKRCRTAGRRCSCLRFVPRDCARRHVERL